MPDDVFVVDTSFAQQSMWLLHQMDPGKPTYNVTAGARIRGPLRADALRRALNDVVDRHEPLRTVFQLEGDVPMQVILPSVAVPLPVTEVHPSELDAAVRREAETPLDIERGPLLRMRLLKVGPDDHILVLIMHHIIFDGWSSAIMIRELSAFYQSYVGGRPAELPELPIQYADYAVWQRETLSGERLEQLLGYWTDHLAAADPLSLPADRPRPAVRSSRGETIEFGFPAELMIALENLGRQRRATLFMVLLAGLQALFSRYSGQHDVTISTAVANRGRPELAGLIGYFVNTLVLRTDISGNPTVTELVDRARNTCLEAYDHQEMPFDKVVESVQPLRDGGVGNALVRAMLVLQNMETEPWESGGLVFEPMRLDTRAALLDLSLTIEPAPGGDYNCSIEYSTDLFDRVTIERFGTAYRQMLEAFVAHPDTRMENLELAGEAHWVQVLSAWNATAEDLPDATVAELIAEQAARTPAAVAVEHGDDRLTYAELEDRADTVAGVLRSHPAARTPGEPIAAIVMTPTLDLAVAVLGSLKSGWAFVPLDPSLPPARVAEMVRASGAQAVLTQDALASTFAEAFDGCRVIRLDRDVPDPGARTAADGPHASGLACVFYTSGSTDVPKGVMFTHRALTNFTLGVVGEFALTADDRYFQLSSIGFDVLLEEMLPILVVGGAVVLPTERILAAGGDLAAHVERHQVTVVDLTPAYWHEWTRELALRGGPPGSLRLAVVGGDRVLPEHVETWRRFGVDLLEGYGLTEACVISTACHLQGAHGPGPSAVVGDPMANTRLHVLDHRLRPVPPGAVGEIYISGEGLARGYLHQPGETAQRFIADPAGRPGTRMCRTGDLARRRADGEVEFIGRVDHQIKIRGHRVEPGGIEAMIASHPGVAEAVVFARDEVGGRRMVAYVAPVPGTDLDSATVRAFAAERLPEVLVPAAVVVLESMPLTSTGKIDRRALEDLVPASPPISRKPADTREELLCRLLAEVLGEGEVGAEDDFFAVGGDSITAIQLASRARAAGLAISPRDVFTRRTPARLAIAAAASDAAAAGEDTGGVGPMPLTPAASELVRLTERPGAFGRAMVLRVPAGITAEPLTAAAQHVLDHHDALRMTLTRGGEGGWELAVAPPGAVRAERLISRVDVAGLDERHVDEAIRERASAARRELDPESAAMGRLVWFDAGHREGRLLVVLHHLVVDEVSWRILLLDLVTAYGAVAAGEPVVLDWPGTSLREWARGLSSAATEPSRAGEFRFWREVTGAPEPLLGTRPLDPGRDLAGTARSLTSTVHPELAGPLLSDVPVTYRAGAHDVLLTGLALAVARWRERRGTPARAVRVMLDGDGRDEQTVAGADLSRTVGRFTVAYPISLDPGDASGDAAASVAAALRAVKEQLRAVPGTGLGYGLLRYLNPETAAVLADRPRPQIGFSYVSRLGVQDDGVLGWSLDRELSALCDEPAPDVPLPHVLQIGVVAEDLPEGPTLTITWRWAADVLLERDVRELADDWSAALGALARHAESPEASRLAPEDLSLVSMSQAEIDDLEDELRSEQEPSA